MKRLTMVEPDSKAELVVHLEGPGVALGDGRVAWSPSTYEVRAARFDLDAEDYGPVHVTVDLIVAGRYDVILDDVSILHPSMELEPGDAYVEVRLTDV